MIALQKKSAAQPSLFSRVKDCFVSSNTNVSFRFVEYHQPTNTEHCKILEWQVMNKKINSNSNEHVQKQHLSFNSRMVSNPFEVFLKYCGCDT